MVQGKIECKCCTGSLSLTPPYLRLPVQGGSSYVQKAPSQPFECARLRPGGSCSQDMQHLSCENNLRAPSQPSRQQRWLIGRAMRSCIAPRSQSTGAHVYTMGS